VLKELYLFQVLLFHITASLEGTKALEYLANTPVGTVVSPPYELMFTLTILNIEGNIVPHKKAKLVRTTQRLKYLPLQVIPAFTVSCR
jgi:hypothetical protein